VIGVRPSLLPPTALPPAAASVQPAAALLGSWWSCGASRLRLIAALLVTLPVFVQAPWVHAHPLATALTTVPLLALGIGLGLSERPGRQQLGALLVGFAGSWLGGSLFWGWCRLHPLWHLPVEALALPLALGGLRSRWQLAGAFYLASLLGTAATDAAMALTGVMPLWPGVVAAAPSEALPLLQQAAERVLQPGNLLLVLAFGLALLALGRWLWQRGGAWRLAGATLTTTLVVDALFLGLCLAAPRWSGLI
jgi:lysylphosphatidylglycerol synthetase-like protein (DUF2156 family)